MPPKLVQYRTPIRLHEPCYYYREGPFTLSLPNQTSSSLYLRSRGSVVALLRCCFALLRCCVATTNLTLCGIRDCSSVSGLPGLIELRTWVNLQKPACEKGMVSIGPSLVFTCRKRQNAVASESEQSRYLNAVQCFLKKPAITPKSVTPGVVVPL